jgi:hypothetical protein
VYLLLYVDDIVLIASNSVLQKTISALQWEFAMKDLGLLHHFLGVIMERRPGGLFLHQCTYLKDIIDRKQLVHYSY